MKEGRGQPPWPAAPPPGFPPRPPPPPPTPPPPWGVPPPSSYKRSPPPHLYLTPPREGSLSPSRIYPPWSRTSEIHVPGGYSARKSFASAASLERGGGGCSVPRTCVRARMRF